MSNCLHPAFREGIDACKSFYADDPHRDDSDRYEWPQNPHPPGSADCDAWTLGWNSYWHSDWGVRS